MNAICGVPQPWLDPDGNTHEGHGSLRNLAKWPKDEADKTNQGFVGLLSKNNLIEYWGERVGEMHDQCAKLIRVKRGKPFIIKERNMRCPC